MLDGSRVAAGLQESNCDESHYGSQSVSTHPINHT
jgi:hypothetical protein